MIPRAEPIRLTGIAWAPDGTNRLFFMRKNGLVEVVENGAVRESPFATIEPVFTESECGLIGLTFDPNYLVNRYLYFFVTVSSTEQQIIRYTDHDNVGIDKTVVIAGLPTLGRNHDGGAIGFGPDGRLYWAIGDLGKAVGTKQDLTTVAAKVARVDLDGSAPIDNPYFDGDGPNDDRIWAMGFRNPFTFTWQPSSERLWVNVTGAAFEQIFTPRAGDDAGWNQYQNNQPDGFLSPIIAYRTGPLPPPQSIVADGAARRDGIATLTTNVGYPNRPGTKVTISGVADASFNGSGYVLDNPTLNSFTIAQPGPDATSGGGAVQTELIGNAVTGGTFWDSSSLPTPYRGDYFFGDYGSGNIMRATLSDADDVTALDVWNMTGRRLIDLAVGPDGNLYYASYDGGINRVSYRAARQGIVVSHLHLRMQEGGQAILSARLAMPPAAQEEIEVQITRASGDDDVVLVSPELVFTEQDWSTPQAILLAAERDGDVTDDEATIEPRFRSTRALRARVERLRQRDRVSAAWRGKNGMCRDNAPFPPIAA